MRMLVLLLLVCGCGSLAPGRSPEAATLNPGSAAAGEPEPGVVRPPYRMTADLTGPVSLHGRVPLTLTLFSKTDGPRRDFTNYSFRFMVLDEDGKQVGGPNVFIREAITVKLRLDGKVATYEPNMSFYRDKIGFVPGRKYQLICVMPACDLAAGVRFTLAERGGAPGR